MLPTRPPLDHFDYIELDETPCPCTICTKYRESHEAYMAYNDMARGHKAKCRCYVCRNRTEAQTTYFAATNQRDTYSELSYLTSEHKLGPQFLSWVYGQINNQRESWWASKASQRCLGDWIEDWQKLYLPFKLWAVSGLIP